MMPKRILIISSDYVVVTLLSKFLYDRIENCSIITVDGLGMLSKETGAEFDMIIIDGVIRGSYGCEIINHLRIKREYLYKIIYLSHTEIERHKALQMGANHVILKPILIDQFISLIRECLKMRG
jgi:DNA-binding response OmpR family regulator